MSWYWRWGAGILSKKDSMRRGPKAGRIKASSALFDRQQEPQNVCEQGIVLITDAAETC